MKVYDYRELEVYKKAFDLQQKIPERRTIFHDRSDQALIQIYWGKPGRRLASSS
jgi:hypothetical protein